jgi:hypothetical protein
MSVALAALVAPPAWLKVFKHPTLSLKTASRAIAGAPPLAYI